MLSKVREKYADFFTPKFEIVEPEDNEFAEEQKRLANDAKVFCETQAYQDLSEGLQALIDTCYADPNKGTDVAASVALKQAGLREAQALLVRVASRREVEYED